MIIFKKWDSCLPFNWDLSLPSQREMSLPQTCGNGKLNSYGNGKQKSQWDGKQNSHLGEAPVGYKEKLCGREDDTNKNVQKDSGI